MNIHVVFGAGGGALKHIFKVNGVKESVLIFVEDLMWGPLGNIFDAAVQEERLKWWESIAEDGDVEYFREGYQRLNTWRDNLVGDENLIFWFAENSPDYTALICFLKYFPESHPVSEINVSKLYRKANGNFKPKTVGEMRPEQLFNLIAEAKPISEKRRESLVSEWERLLAEKGNLRIYENKVLKTVEVNYFDDELLQRSKKISKERTFRKDDGFLPEIRLIGEVIGHSKQVVDDWMIKWRIAHLINRGLFEAKEFTFMDKPFLKIRPVYLEKGGM